jgi:hypothetical protein
MLARKLRAGAEEAEREGQAVEAAGEARQQAKAEANARARAGREMRAAERAQPRTRSTRRADKSMVEQVTGSSVFREMARTAGREIVRSIFGTARRRRR